MGLRDALYREGRAPEILQEGVDRTQLVIGDSEHVVAEPPGTGLGALERTGGLVAKPRACRRRAGQSLLQFPVGHSLPAGFLGEAQERRRSPSIEVTDIGKPQQRSDLQRVHRPLGGHLADDQLERLEAAQLADAQPVARRQPAREVPEGTAKLLLVDEVAATLIGVERDPRDRHCLLGMSFAQDDAVGLNPLLLGRRVQVVLCRRAPVLLAKHDPQGVGPLGSLAQLLAASGVGGDGEAEIVKQDGDPEDEPLGGVEGDLLPTDLLG